MLKVEVLETIHADLTLTYVQMIQNAMMQIMGVQFPGQGGTPGSGMGGNSFLFASRIGLGGPGMSKNVKEVEQEEDEKQNGPCVVP